MITIKIGDRTFKVQEAKTEEEKKKGLQKIESLPLDEGMLFYFDPGEEVSMWMKDVSIPLDMIFINEDYEVIAVHQGVPQSEELITVPDTTYVLEVNIKSGVKVGDELELDSSDEGPVMKVLFPDGSEQYLLWGGERIFSRKNTKVLIRKAKKAQASQDDKDFKALGRYMFKCIKVQDERKPEYVTKD